MGYGSAPGYYAFLSVEGVNGKALTECVKSLDKPPFCIFGALGGSIGLAQERVTFLFLVRF